jgi:tetratricopeptide (TPR) repeat protein
MFSVFNRFIDWFMQRPDESDALRLQSAGHIMSGLADVTVLLADPDGVFASEEAKDLLLKSVIEPLNQRPGVNIYRYPKTLKPKIKGDLKTRFAEVAETGREWLIEQKADLLIWGKVEVDLQAVRWYFLSRKDMPQDLGMPDMAENILVPFDAEEAVMAVFYAAIFAATVPEHPSHAFKIGEHLLGAVEPLTKLPAGLTQRKTIGPVKASVMGMAAVVLSNIARRGDGLGWFDPALKAFQSWDEFVDRKSDPIEWALVRIHHAWLYDQLAGRDDDELALEHIETATKYFKQVCEVFTQKDFPHEWAMVQIRIATGYARVGKMHSEPEYLQKAARFYKYAQEVFTYAKHTMYWADLMCKMAKILLLHGQMVRGAQSLEQAGVAFQAALKVYTYEKYPALWANTQNNLGATLFALAKRDPSTHEWLDHAINCFHDARSYYDENNKAQMVHVIDKNIVKAHRLRDQIRENMTNDLLN